VAAVLDDPARGGVIEARQEPEQAGLARERAAEHHVERARLDRERELAEVVLLAHHPGDLLEHQRHVAPYPQSPMASMSTAERPSATHGVIVVRPSQARWRKAAAKRPMNRRSPRVVIIGRRPRLGTQGERASQIPITTSAAK